MLDVMEAPLQTQHLHATVHVQQGIIVLQVRAVLLKMHVVQGIIVQPVQVPQHNALQDIMDLRLPTQ